MRELYPEFTGHELGAEYDGSEDLVRDFIPGRKERIYLQAMVSGKVSVFRVSVTADTSGYKVYETIDQLMEEWSFDGYSKSLIIRRFPHLKNKAA